jgi:hypothetical protein
LFPRLGADGGHNRRAIPRRANAALCRDDNEKRKAKQGCGLHSAAATIEEGSFVAALLWMTVKGEAKTTAKPKAKAKAKAKGKTEGPVTFCCCDNRREILRRCAPLDDGQRRGNT